MICETGLFGTKEEDDEVEESAEGSMLGKGAFYEPLFVDFVDCIDFGCHGIDSSGGGKLEEVRKVQVEKCRMSFASDSAGVMRHQQK